MNNKRKKGFNQNKGFNQMMSILMLGLISAAGGVGVAAFAGDQQSNLTQTTGSAGLREAITIENVDIGTGIDAGVNIVLRNTGTVDVDIGAIYMNGVSRDISDFDDDELNLTPGEGEEFNIESGLDIEQGTQHQFKVTTTGGGVVTTSATAPQQDVLIDNTAPVIILTNCTDQIGIAPITQLDPNDLCDAEATDSVDGSVDVSNDADFDALFEEDDIITITFTAIDASGNTGEATQTITVVDS